MAEHLHSLCEEIRACQLCREEMDRPPNPVFQVSASARILVAGQAPGNLADKSGIPFTDPSGDRLRDWMGVSEEVFYDAGKIALVPMGFCFPGYDDKGGDRPPMKRCAETWREQLLSALPSIQLTILIGQYAQKWHLGSARGRTLTETVERWQTHLAGGIFPLPHPSWRNNAWLKKHPWFAEDALPALREKIAQTLKR